MSILTPRSPRAAGLVVAVLLGLAPAASVMAQAAPSYDTLLERLDQLPGARVGSALAEAADAGAQDDLPRPPRAGAERVPLLRAPVSLTTGIPLCRS